MNSVPFASPDSLSEQRPTSVRYRVLFVTFLTSLLLYLDRFCMTYAQRYVKEDLGLSEAQIDSCMSIFFLSYGLSQVPTGGLTDKYGSRIMLAIYVLAWSLFTAAMGWVGGFVSLLIVRLAAGMSQAGAYPTGARVVGQWTPLARRGVANSIIALGGRVGGALAPPLTAALVVAFVPLSVSPLLTNDDLLDPVGLSAQLAGDAKPQPSGEELTADQRLRPM
ncbi:MAG: MFS transporter [Planctomycetaceae bacterium]